MRLESSQVAVAGETVRYRVAGTGPPLVLVHGLSGSTRWWRRNLDALAESHRVHLVDLPGFGAMARRRFVLGEAASWLLAWLDAIGTARTSLVGHSMGAAIALRAAAARPDAVGRLVLVAPAGLRTQRSFVGHALPLASVLRTAPPSLLLLLARDAAAAGPWTLLRAARALHASDVREVLPAVTAPTLVLFGARDTLTPVSLADAYRRGLRDARVVVLPDAGHVPMLEAPRAFEAEVLGFLAGRPASEPLSE